MINNGQENRVTQKYFVAFLDILGFSNKVKMANTEKAEREILNVLKLIKNDCDSTNSDKSGILDGLKLLAVSDSIIISVPFKETAAATKFVYKILQLAYDLLVKSKLLIRGGVTIGEYYCHENIFFGKALIEAIELEKKAKVPKILISDAFMYELYKAEKNTPYHDQLMSISRFITPSEYHLDYLKAVFLTEGNLQYEAKDLEEHIVKINNIIQEGKEQNRCDSSTLEKYMWFEQHFNCILQKYQTKISTALL